MVFVSICTALYDYPPQGDGELELQEGELIYVLDKSGEDDWWKAKKRATSEEEEEPTGLIPNNYVEEAQPTHNAKALYDYTRQTDEELSFSDNAALEVYDTSDADWTLVGLDGEFGFVPANYIEITDKANGRSPPAPISPPTSDREKEPGEPVRPSQPNQAGPAAALAGIMHGIAPSNPSLPPRQQQLTPDESDEEGPAPSLPKRPPSQQVPDAQSYPTPRSPTSPGIAASPPYNRVVSQNHDEDQVSEKGGFHLYNINEVVSTMGKNKKLPTTLGLNVATGVIMIAPEKSRDGPSQEWTAEKLTHYSIEGKHVFMELVRPSKSIDFHAGAKDTAHEIVAGLGEIAGASRAEGLREVLEAGSGGGGQKKGKMLYEFMAQGDDEVTVAVDDEVIILDDTKSEEWWMVKRLKNGKEGVVPSSYVEVTGIIPPPRSSSGINTGKSIVEQNRLEEERLTKEAARKSKPHGETISEPKSKKESKHQKSSSTSKSKPDTTKLRTWTDRSGTFKVEAQFIGLKESKIHLHKLNGVKIAVPVQKMAVEDLEFVEKATGQSLDDEKPLSDIKRRSTQADRSKGKTGASVEKSAQPKPQGPEYDWFDFFLKAGVSPYQCERYAYNFRKDSMDENVLSEITPTVLRTLGLKEGDILRVMKYLDTKFGRTGGGATSPDNSGGLFSGPGGALRNNTSKSRPAPPVQSNDVVDANALKPKANGEAKVQERLDSSEDRGPTPPRKNSVPRGFDDDAWDVKPSKQPTQPAQQPSQTPKAAASPPVASAPPQQPGLTGSLLDLSLLSTPLQPTPAPKTSVTSPPQTQPIQQPPPQLQSQQQQQQLTGANPSFFSQIPQQPTGAPSQQQQSQQGFSLQPQNQQNFQPQSHTPQNVIPRQRPQAPQQMQTNPMVPPPPARPLSAPQTQQNSNFGPPPLQPQLTGYHPQQGHFQQQLAPPGQSMNDMNQQRLQQQPFNQQHLQPQQTGFGQQMQPAGFSQQPQAFNQFQNGIQPQPTGFVQQYQSPLQQSGLQNLPNPYVNGQINSQSPFADPRGQQQPLQPQPTGFQSPPSFQQPQQTGNVNSVLQPALQPQSTGANINGFSRPGFGQPPPPMPPMPSIPTQQAPQQQQNLAAAPLQPQKTGPAPPVRFGTQANKLVPQKTGRANLAAATPSNPFGF